MHKETEQHTILSWKAPEFHYHKKGQWWFPVQALVTFALTAFFILTRQFLVAIIIVLGAIVLYRLAHQEPAVVSVQFTPRGLKYKGQNWDFRELKSYWIIQTGDRFRLHLQPIRRFAPSVALPLAVEDIDKTRDFLSHYLPETIDATEDLADRLNRWLRI